MTGTGSYADRVTMWQSRVTWGVEMTTVLQAMHIQPGMRFLDFGAHTGAAMNMARSMTGLLEVTGVETNPEALAENPYPETMHQTLDTVPGLFDRILCSNTLGHVDDPKETLWHLCDILNHGGIIAVVVPNPAYDWVMSPKNWFTGYKSDPTLKHSLSKFWIMDRMVECGLVPHRAIYLGEKVTWLPAWMQPSWMRCRFCVLGERPRRRR